MLSAGRGVRGRWTRGALQVRAHLYIPSERVLDLLEAADVYRCFYENEGNVLALIQSLKLEQEATRLVREEQRHAMQVNSASDSN